MQRETLIFRADADSEIGVGHVMRCLALAQAWQAAGHRAVFAVGACPSTLCDRLYSEGCEVALLHAGRGSCEDGKETISLAQRYGSRNVVLDGGAFDSEYEKQIKHAGLRLVVLDDYAKTPHCDADAIWNADPVACEKMYSGRGPSTRLLLGPTYALLRREFLPGRTGENRTQEKSSNVLITMGGSDPQNMTLTALRGLAVLNDPGLKIRVLVGSANPRLELLHGAARETTGGVEVLSDVHDMPAQMIWADVAVAAAGGTLWELLHMGVAVVAWPRYPADVANLKRLAELGAVLALEREADAEDVAAGLRTLLPDAERARRMRHAGRELVDGKGAERVVQFLEGLPSAQRASEA